MKTKTLLAGAATAALAALAATEPAPPAGPAPPTAPPTGPPAGPQATAPAAPPAPAPAAAPAAPVPPDGPVRKALDWLAARQRDDGGWGQGGGWRVDTANQGGGRIEGDQVPDPSDVGNTAIALKAFLRAGTRLDTGDFSATARKAADYLLAAVEKADGESLHVTDVRGTQLQSKIGPYVDTFLALQVLSDLKGLMPDPSSEERRARCLAKLAAKVEKHQQDDGSFDGNLAWAATVSQGLASRALNSAWAAGAPVSALALERDHRQNATGLDPATGQVASSGGVSDAGVAIYRYASKLGGMDGFAKNNGRRREEIAQVAASPDASQAEKDKAREELAAIERADRDKEVLLGQVVRQAGEQQFVAGFGSNGGEEFASYMNIAEALHTKGGKPWNEWQARMDDLLHNAQHADGSWSGQHCITGRTFCTSTAVLVLTTDRLPGGDGTARQPAAQ